MSSERINRILPEVVLAAYKETGFMPIQGDWYREDSDDFIYACALSAVMHNYCKVSPSFLRKLSSHVFNADEEVAKTLNTSTSYVVGFTSGFDSLSDIDPSYCVGLEDFKLGCKDGKAARDLIKREVGEIYWLGS